MRKAACLLVGALLLGGCAGYEVVPTEDQVLQRVHELDATKERIFDRSIEWIAKNFTDSKAVLEVKDREGGKIIGKGITPIENGMAFIRVRFTLVIDIKDGKYRATYSDFIGMWPEAERPLDQKLYVDKVRSNLIILDEKLFGFLEVKEKDW